jgi:hypothetical protein
MPVDQAGVDTLISLLRIDTVHYDQTIFGRTFDACGTTCCIAGLALINEIGLEAFNARVKPIHSENGCDEEMHHALVFDCLTAAHKLLGLPPVQIHSLHTMPVILQIFGNPLDWPSDLTQEYRHIAFAYERDHHALAEVAVKALSRLNDDGTIRPKESS